MKFVTKNLLPNEKFLPTSSRLTLEAWIKRANITLRNKRYSLRRHEYLEQVLRDESPFIVFRKAAQVGISTLMLIKSIWVAEHLGGKVVYYFPNDQSCQDFSSDRLAPMIETSSYLVSRVRATDRVGLKQIGPGSIYVRGLQTKAKAKSIDCDMVVLDELDEAPEELIEFALDRLRHSELGWAVMLSQPSMPGWGIDRRFNLSDQKHWHIICDSCGHRNCLELEFPANFIPIPQNQKRKHPEGATHYRGCSKCQAKLNMAHGEWIALKPGQFISGYHISQLYSQIQVPGFPNVASRIMYEYENKKASSLGLENFNISMLGFPYSSNSVRITDETLDGIEGDYGVTLTGNGCYMGVDQGDELCVVVGMMSGNVFKVIYLERTEKWGRLETLMDQFGVAYCLIDAMPNKHSAKQFAAKFPNRVSIQYFQNTSFRRGEETLEGRVTIPTVCIDRTESLDQMIDEMEMLRIIVPSRHFSDERWMRELEVFRRHLKQLVTTIEYNSKGAPVRSYLSGKIENHYGMALNSAYLAAKVGVFQSPIMVKPIFVSAKHGEKSHGLARKTI